MLAKQEGKEKEAVDAFEKAIEYNLYDADTHYQKGVVLVKLKEYREAVNAFDIAILFNPNDARAHYQRKMALKELPEGSLGL